MVEKWEIVDENGIPTGEILDRNNPRAYQDGIYHFAADVWILNSDNKILIQKRSKNKKVEPNVWAMTGGNVFLGENPKDALVREVKEELDVDIDPNELIYITRVKSSNALIETFFIRLDYDISKMKYKDKEVTDSKWATWDEINNLVNNGEFFSNRWNHVSEYLKKEIEKTR